MKKILILAAALALAALPSRAAEPLSVADMGAKAAECIGWSSTITKEIRDYWHAPSSVGDTLYNWQTMTVKHVAADGTCTDSTVKLDGPTKVLAYAGIPLGTGGVEFVIGQIQLNPDGSGEFVGVAQNTQ